MSDFPDGLLIQASKNQSSSLSKAVSASQSSSVFDVDEDIEEFLRSSLPKVQVVGVGGGGNNAIDRLMEQGILGA
ncbi:MAG: hypothetical protein ACE5OZ_25710, partial [Candidatus Heimdallarchaeota archaeon]